LDIPLSSLPTSSRPHSVFNPGCLRAASQFVFPAPSPFFFLSRKLIRLHRFLKNPSKQNYSLSNRCFFLLLRFRECTERRMQIRTRLNCRNPLLSPPVNSLHQSKQLAAALAQVSTALVDCPPRHVGVVALPARRKSIQRVPFRLFLFSRHFRRVKCTREPVPSPFSLRFFFVVRLLLNSFRKLTY